LHYIAVQHSKTALTHKSNLNQSKQKTPNPTFAQSMANFTTTKS